MVYLHEAIQHGDDIGKQVDDIPVTRDLRVIGDESFDDLVGEMQDLGLSFTEDDIVKITRGFDGKGYWLEIGTNTVELNHIRARGHIEEIIDKFHLPISNDDEFSEYLVGLLNTQPVHIRVQSEDSNNICIIMI